jgi:hypothetical protein
MGYLEIIEKERTLDEIEDFSGNILEQSKINCSIGLKNNVFLTSLVIGASLITTSHVSAKSFEIETTAKEGIRIIKEYNENINESLVDYINIINSISKRNISKTSLLKNILSFKSLTESWDGFGAIPLEIESATNSIQLLDLIGEDIFCTLNNFYPNPNGTISFEWENLENEIISLEVGNKTFSYFVEMSSKDVMFFNNRSINAKDAEKLSEFIQAI